MSRLFRRQTSHPREQARHAWGARGAAAATIAARLTFEGVERRYGSGYALAGVSLDVAPGEVVCLLGPSGCGKTTLLRIAAGIEKPSAGRVLINGREVAGPDRFVLPEERNVGLMFQDFALFPHLTILDNVAFGLGGIARSEAEQAALGALERVGLARYAGNYPHILSGGEQQRVALARAIAPRPSVLMMDEPFSGLDVRLREFMQEQTLTILRETRSTCIIVTHDPEEAMRLGDRIAVMREGRIVQVGDAEDLYRRPADLFVARFFSEVNEIHTTRADARAHLPAVPGLGKYSDGDGEAAIVLCLRQRGIILVPSGEGLAGRVMDVRFLGDQAVVEVAVEGFDETLRARVGDGTAPARGSEVAIRIDPTAVLIFPDESV